MRQQWIKVCIGIILIVAVLIEISVRQTNIFGRPASQEARQQHGAVVMADAIPPEPIVAEKTVLRASL
jgi:hypothetical protein